MTVDDLIALASVGPLKASDVEQTADGMGTTVIEMFDRFARRIADGYTSGVYDFNLCDGAMTYLFTYAHTASNIGLSPFAWGVFEAFDQGEFRGEEVTRDLLARVLSHGSL